jgi:hypothetical protein
VGPDRPADIAREVEQAARIRDTSGMEAAQCQGGARQRTQHHGGAADELLPENPQKSVSNVMKPLPTMPNPSKA